MDSLRDICLAFSKTQEEYKKFKENSGLLRDKCDNKIREEIMKFADEMEEIAQCAKLLLDNFDYYGNAIRFPVKLAEAEEDCITICFSQKDYCISRSFDDVILFKSSTDLDEFSISSFEYLIMNKTTILQITADKIKAFLISETEKMANSMAEENAYYETLCSTLFPEEHKDE